MSARWLHKASGREVASFGGFPIVYADPPWQYENDGRGAAENHYRTMPFDEIAALPVPELCAPDALLFMWAVWPMLPEALALMIHWGFSFKNCAFVWVKTTKDGTRPHTGMGHYTRGNSEPCLLGTRGRATSLIQSHAVSQVVAPDWCASVITPRGAHSAKPQEVRNRIVELCGNRPAIEMFARDRDPRFEVWGNEVHQTITLEAA